MTDSPRLMLGPDHDRLLVVVEGEHVASLQALSPHQSPPERSLSCDDCYLEPGRINAHTHIYSGLAPLGIPPPEVAPENFPQILERIWWRLDRALDEASLRASARLYAAESLLAGTTTLIDHHESPNFIQGSLDVLADACQELGIRAVLGYGATDRNGGVDEGRRGLEECRRFLIENDRPLVRGVVALHASFTVSDETIQAAADLCRELGAIMHVHLAEDGVDIDDARRRGHEGPLERLLSFGALPPGSILAHCVHCSRGQVGRADAERLWIVQNPRSNRGNEVGYPKALDASDRVALGTDGYPASMDDEAAALEAEAVAHGENVDTARRRLDGGHELAAERFGETFAPLAEGSAADVVAMEDGRAGLVVVGGRVVVQDGHLLTADLEEIRTAARQQAPKLWERMRAL